MWSEKQVRKEAGKEQNRLEKARLGLGLVRFGELGGELQGLRGQTHISGKMQRMWSTAACEIKGLHNDDYSDGSSYHLWGHYHKLPATGKNSSQTLSNLILKAT